MRRFLNPKRKKSLGHPQQPISSGEPTNVTVGPSSGFRAQVEAGSDGKSSLPYKDEVDLFGLTVALDEGDGADPRFVFQQETMDEGEVLPTLEAWASGSGSTGHGNKHTSE
jgi:hypothetical protein